MQKSKILGWLAIIPIILLLSGTLILASISPLAMIHLSSDDMILVLALLKLKFAVLVFCFYLGIKLLKGQPFLIKNNSIITFILIAGGIIYFIYAFGTELYHQINHNNNAFRFEIDDILKLILPILWGSISVSFGIASMKDKL